MDKSKLVEMLRTLSTDEMKEFSKYMESNTSFRKTGGVFAMFNYLKKHHPEFPAKKIDKEVVHKKIFKGEKKFNRRFFDLMSQLYKTLEDFLVLKKLEEKEIERNFLLLEVLKERKLDNLFFLKINSIEKEWEKNPPPGIEQLHNEYKLAYACFMHPQYSTLPNSPIGPDSLLKEIEKYYFSLKLYYNVLLTNRGNYYINNNKEEFTALLNNSLVTNHTIPQVQIYALLLKAYKENHFKEYKTLKKHFVDNLKFYTKYEKRDILILLEGYCIKDYYINKNIESLKNLFNIYQYGIEHKLYIEDGYIESNNFINIVNVACSIKELDWANNFIKQNNQFLQLEEQSDIIALCSAIVSFNKEDYEQVLTILSTVKFQDANYAIQARGFLLKTYYELDYEYEELFFNLVKSFSIYLNRNKLISENIKIANLNFIKFINKLQLIKNDSPQNIENLLKEMNNIPMISYKKWLLSKVNSQLKKQKPYPY